MTGVTRPYHHGNLREALVRAAADLAREQGPGGVVLREVARRTGVSHNAAYRHFADRDALLAQVALDGMARLADHMRAAVDQVDGPDPVVVARRRLSATGRAYVEFALTEPGFFAVAFADVAQELMSATIASPAPGDRADADPYALLNLALDDLVAVGAVTPARREGAEVACWAAVHGFAQLHLGPLKGVSARERATHLEAMLEVIESGLVQAPG
jgi:AcrR family transcriptional regulator